jgi:hypothetical protein
VTAGGAGVVVDTGGNVTADSDNRRGRVPDGGAATTPVDPSDHQGATRSATREYNKLLPKTPHLTGPDRHRGYHNLSSISPTVTMASRRVVNNVEMFTAGSGWPLTLVGNCTCDEYRDHKRRQRRDDPLSRSRNNHSRCIECEPTISEPVL